MQLVALDARTISENLEIVNEERLKLFGELDDHDPDSEEYEAVMTRLIDLQKVEESLSKQALDIERLKLEQDRLYVEAAPRPLSKDALIGAAATLGGIMLVIGYELFGEGIVTSKAFSLIPKIRLG
jgi:hypothetical protein